MEIPRRGTCGLVSAFVLVAAGCGGSASPSVAHVGSTTSAAATAAASASSSTNPLARIDAFAACMRSNGVPRFPDPTRVGGGIKLVIGPGSGINPNSAAFRKASKACASLAPAARGGGARQPDQQQLAGMLSFAKCMRSHGVSSFPDPNARSGFTLQAIQAAGVDVHSTKVFSTAQACIPASNGAVTAAQVKRAEQAAAGGGQGP